MCNPALLRDQQYLVDQGFKKVLDLSTDEFYQNHPQLQFLKIPLTNKRFHQLHNFFKVTRCFLGQTDSKSPTLITCEWNFELSLVFYFAFCIDQENYDLESMMKQVFTSLSTQNMRDLQISKEYLAQLLSYVDDQSYLESIKFKNGFLDDYKIKDRKVNKESRQNSMTE